MEYTHVDRRAAVCSSLSDSDTVRVVRPRNGHVTFRAEWPNGDYLLHHRLQFYLFFGQETAEEVLPKVYNLQNLAECCVSSLAECCAPQLAEASKNQLLPVSTGIKQNSLTLCFLLSMPNLKHFTVLVSFELSVVDRNGHGSRGYRNK